MKANNQPAEGTCACELWIQSLPVPSKLLIFNCESCHTEYKLYPNGQIAYEQLEPLQLGVKS